MNVNEILSNLTEKEIKEKKKNAIEMQTLAGQRLDDIVIKLEKLRRQGKLNYYANFNGTKIYSLDVTMDSAYKECLKCSRKAWLRKEKRWMEKAKAIAEKKKKETQEKLPYWIEEGKKYIHSEKKSNWEKICIASANGDYSGLEVEKTIEIMKMLDEGKLFKEIKEKVQSDGHSGMSYSKTMRLVLLYANRGPALYKFMNRKKSYNKIEKYVQKIEELNRKLDMGYKYEEATESLKEHKIMDIAISRDLPKNYDSIDIEYYSNYYQGTILINDDLTFEGILENDEFITGKIIEDRIVSLATFCNYKKPSHYFGINQEDGIIARHEIYSTSQGIVEKGKVFIGLFDSLKDFTDEINIEDEIQEIKNCFDDDILDMYNWFSQNFDSETERNLSIMRDDLNQRLVNALTNQNSTGNKQKTITIGK